MLFLALYRFGSVLWMPIYVQARTLYLTWTFYVWALLPMALLLHVVFHFFDVYKAFEPKQTVINGFKNGHFNCSKAKTNIALSKLENAK